jgi:acetylornithine deacetylase/succinyl-diaminopimelate desuccinylase-like protein
LFEFFSCPAITPSPPARNTGVASATTYLATQASFRVYVERLSLPTDAANPADIVKNVEWLEAAFRKRGFTTQQLSNNGKPLMFGEYKQKAAGAKTVVFYMLFDGMPVTPENWAQKSPWVPVLKQRNAPGAWEGRAYTDGIPARPMGGRRTTQNF